MYYDKMNVYTFNLLKTRTNALNQLVKDIFSGQDSIDHDRFVDLLSMKYVLQNPWQLRSYMETVFKTTPVEEKKQISATNAFANLMGSAAPTEPAKPEEIEMEDQNHS
jgi:hypothetical protein